MILLRLLLILEQVAPRELFGQHLLPEQAAPVVHIPPELLVLKALVGTHLSSSNGVLEAQ
jgi:hypothetical protein